MDPVKHSKAYQKEQWINNKLLTVNGPRGCKSFTSEDLESIWNVSYQLQSASDHCIYTALNSIKLPLHWRTTCVQYRKRSQAMSLPSSSAYPSSGKKLGLVLSL